MEGLENSHKFTKKEKDIWKYTGGLDIPAFVSPHNVFHNKFILDHDPVVDAFESHMSLATNLRNYGRWKKTVLKTVPRADEAIIDRLVPIFERYEPLIDEYNKFMGELAELHSQAKAVPVLKASPESGLGGVARFVQLLSDTL